MLSPAGHHAPQTAWEQVTSKEVSATMQEPARVCLESALGTLFQILLQLRSHAGHHARSTVCKAGILAVDSAPPMGELSH